MKHLKNFKSLFEGDNHLGDATREIFDIWEVYKFYGPGIGFICKQHLDEIDWERGDYLDSPDSHVKVYSADGIDKSGLEFQAEYMVIDDHISELDLDNLEINDNTLDEKIYDIIRSNGHPVRHEKDPTYGYVVKTSAEWEDILGMFKKSLNRTPPQSHGKDDATIVIEDKEYEIDLMLTWNVVKAAEDKKEARWFPRKVILYVKSKQGEEIWAVYDHDR